MSGGASEALWRLALAIGLAALLLAALMTLLVLVLRLVMLQRDRRRHALERTWLPLLARAAAGEPLPASLTLPAGRERLLLALAWTRLQAALRGSAHAHLNRVAVDTGLRDDARRWSAPGHRRLVERRVGLAMMGYLAEAEDLPALRAALHDPRPGIGLAAARALLRVDPEGSTAAVLDRFEGRSDWSVSEVGALLRDARSPALTAALVQRLLAGSGAAQRRLLPLLPLAETPHQESVVSRLAQHSDDPQVLAMAMRRVHDPGAATRVRELARHPDALVRSAAAQALGQMGVDEDAQLLTEMMADQDWWVRHRAAQARVRLPSSAREDLRQLGQRLQDRYARDALAQALAERALASGAPA